VNRCAFLAGTGVVLLDASLAAEAGSSGKVWRIGYQSGETLGQPTFWEGRLEDSLWSS
jgi:hypothetical protein